MCSLYRLREHQHISVWIHDIELDLSVVLPRETAPDGDLGPAREFIEQRLHVLRIDVHIPRVAMACRRVIRFGVAVRLLQEDLDVVTSEDPKTGWKEPRLKADPFVPARGCHKIANEEHHRGIAEFRGLLLTSQRLRVSHGAQHTRRGAWP